MKKLIYSISIVSLIVLGLYTYNHNKVYIKEASNIKNDIMNDYDDLIIKKGNDEEKVVALTFDDGPDEDFTPQVLDILKKYNVKATFFVVGEKVQFNPEILKMEKEEGHEIGNHTFTHINVEKRNYQEVEREISKTQEAIKKVIDKEPKLFRPPYRAINKNICDIIKNKNMNIVLWSNLDPRDWSNPGVYSIVNTIITKVENGNIILLHDYNKARTPKSQTIQALETVIPSLQKKGFKFVTVSELIDHVNKDKEKNHETRN
ncbi:polysaccharide deacetylase family protein [Romboutsia maritimum]|uniref:Polysaccharide deacetylase family protein n=1 Tax=Romboutsia maritimum TaxID=2020948 RepID=A0A371IWP7_9FIRM|nr:polysaccharide deacetylase family protein [Romboutsia maritimum]RDY24895.1 polysaccharide deacetylase family protein [Romboutsia maritimum]